MFKTLLTYNGKHYICSMKIRLITFLAPLILAACNTTFTSIPEDGSVIVQPRLSNLKINDFTQDKDGHIWIATGRGLNKYTGAEYFQYYSTDDTLGLPDNQISAIHAAHDGHLWIATVGGVAVRTSQDSFRRIPVPGYAPNMSQILETADGKLLFSNTNTLFIYNKEQDCLSPVIREFNAFGNPSAVIKDERLWVLTQNGFALCSYSTRDFSLQETVPLPMQTYHICSAGNDELWLSGMGQIRILDTRSSSWKELPPSIKAESRIIGGDVDIMFAVDNTSILLNVIGKGFFHYSRSLGTVSFQGDADFPFDVPGAEVRTIFRDRSDNIWFGTTDRGFHISHHQHGQFGSNKFLTAAMKGKSVTSLCVDKSGGLWMCTLQDGLYRYDLAARTLQQVPIRELIPDSGVGYIRTSKVFCDSDGDLWLLFQDKVRAIRCQWNGRRLISKDVVFTASPLSITEDDRGAIWLGDFGGNLVRFDKRDKSRQDLSLSNQIGWTVINDLIMKDPGRLIAACFNNPPVNINTYSMEIMPAAPGDEQYSFQRSPIIPQCLRQDSAGNIWLGTYANGLILSETATGAKRPVDGAPCMDICAIEEDRHGNIWVSTMNGLGKYDRTVGSFVHYYEADGIGGDQFNDRASCVLPDGSLVFGGTHGITWFNPLDAPAKRTVPLVFESLSIHNQLIHPTDGGPVGKQLAEKPTIVIKHNENGFGISFAALDYSPFEQIRYAYKLDNFDKDWVKIGTRHDVYFANLPAGRYTLRVRITNGSHSITETEESLQIRVLPPWYATWWARVIFTLFALLLIATGWSFYRHIRRVRREAARRIHEIREERQKAEEAKAAEKALNKIQMNYFANVAHEFRTPLTMIAGPAQQLATSPELKGQDKQLVNIIGRNATWMLSLVNQLLDFNRIGNSKLQMKVVKMDIVEPLKEIEELFRFNAESKGIELCSYGLEEPFTMWADADKVQKMVMNLLSNALKYTPSGGKVSLGFDVISRADAEKLFPLTEADTDGQWASISVSDAGPGIPEDQLEKIFERFYQTPVGKKTVTGSGIGLYYARALSTMHHGFIKAWNREEGGATFRILLPVSASSYSDDERTTEAPDIQINKIPEAIPVTETSEDNDKRHVVVVDDDIDIANYLKVMLKPYYKVSLYFDGASALKGMKEQAPDLVISDVVMPGSMDGYELCSSIKGDLLLSHIPVVLVTAKVAVESQVQGLDKGADAYVTKPFQPAYLLALVKSLLENRDKLHHQLGSVTTTEELAPEALSPRDAAFMKELYELMEKELANADLDIVRMTEILKISRTKFYYKVKGLTGENPSVFFKRYKLNRAADLLKEGKHNMSEIAWMTGFNTLSHFSTSFKKQFGVPPSEYVG